MAKAYPAQPLYRLRFRYICMNRQRLAGYLYSLPERVVRSLSAIVGGTVHELGDVILPARVRRSRLYYALVESTSRFLVEYVGQVESEASKGDPFPDDFLIRRTAGNVVEIAGLAAFRASPVWVLAALSDLAGAGRELIQEISATLQKDGLLEPGSTFESVDQLLDGLERSSARLAQAVNTPPLNVKSLREEWRLLRNEASQIPNAVLPSPERLWNQWMELKQEADSQGRTVVELSSVMALAAVRNLPDNARWLSTVLRTSSRRTGEMLARGLLDHYRDTLVDIHNTGYLRYWIREFRPYFIGAANQFSPKRVSTTERLLTKRRKPG